MDEDIVGFDRFGFAIFREGTDSFEDDHRFHESRDEEVEDSSTKYSTTRILKILDSTNLCSPVKLRTIIRKHHLTVSVRQKLWNHLLDTAALRNNTVFNYQESLAEIRSFLVDMDVSEYGHKNFIAKTGVILAQNVTTDSENVLIKQLTPLRQIMLDIGRSFPTHHQFLGSTEEGREGLASLFRVLAVYVKYNPEVSYCQGMSYIAGMLLMQMPEEECFWALVTLFERAKYLAGYFDSSLSKIQRHAQVFERLLKQRLPALHKHLEQCGVFPLMYITPWFMSVFTSLPCWDVVLTIWDLLMLDGFSLIFQVALSIMDVLSEQLMKESDLALILPVLLRLPTELMKHEILVPAIFRNKVHKWEIDSIQQVIAEEEVIVKEKENMKRSLAEEVGPNLRSKRQKVPLREQQRPETNRPSMLKKVVDLVSWPFRATPPVEDTTRPVRCTIQAGQSPVVSPMCCTLPASASKMLLSEARQSRVNQHGKSRDAPLHRAHKRPITAKHIRGLDLHTPLRRSPRIMNKSRNSPYMKFFSPQNQTSITSSAKAQHAFRVFNTPTPLRLSQMKSVHRRRSGVSSGHKSPSAAALSPMDIELTEVQPEASPLSNNIAMQLAFSPS